MNETALHRGVYRLSIEELQAIESEEDLHTWMSDQVTNETDWCVNGFSYLADVECHEGVWSLVCIVNAELDMTE